MLGRWGVSRQHVQLVLVLFVVALVAKGGVLVRGEAIDDYVYASGLGAGGLNAYFGQGRFLQGLIVGAIDSIGVNLSDLYLVFGLLALILQAIVVVAMLRFVGLADVPGVGLVGALMVAQPYSTEILTFRVALPAYCVMLVLLVLTLEFVARSPTRWSTRTLAFALTLAAFFTYQTILNYLLLAVVFSWIASEMPVTRLLDSASQGNHRHCYRQRTLALLLATIGALIAFTLVLWIAESLKWVVVSDERARLIPLDAVPARIGEVVSTLRTMYWSGEPIFPKWLKLVWAALLVLSILTICKALIKDMRGKNRFWTSVALILTLVMLAPLSIGMIIPFKAWWPVPRVIAHSAIIVGLLFAMADQYATGSVFDRWNRRVQTAGRGILLVAFMIIDNQIFADQQRVNEWDRMLANRLIARLEALPEFPAVKFVHISGGSWGYPAPIRTVQGDMNISAMGAPWSKITMLAAASGYRLVQAKDARMLKGEGYCKSATPWPATDSIAIDGDLAIICLAASK